MCLKTKHYYTNKSLGTRSHQAKVAEAAEKILSTRAGQIHTQVDRTQWSTMQCVSEVVTINLAIFLCASLFYCKTNMESSYSHGTMALLKCIDNLDDMPNLQWTIQVEPLLTARPRSRRIPRSRGVTHWASPWRRGRELVSHYCTAQDSRTAMAVPGASQ